jgi:ubiquinone/menaquinone biosynthesis C-methylase UbiE
MSMDNAWKEAYNIQAVDAEEDYKKVFWTKEGYEQHMRLIPQIMKSFKTTPHVLDVGCGLGEVCAILTKEGFSTYGVDYSQKLVEGAKERHPKLDFAVADGYNLPFPDKSFDVVVCIGVVQCVLRLDEFLTELCRVAKHGIVLSTLLTEEPLDIEAELKELLKDDPWPTREYNPHHITDVFKKHGFSSNVQLLDEFGNRINDGGFIIARK